MEPGRLRALLERVRAGETEVEHAMGELRDLPFRDLGYAQVDHHRALRVGAPEVIFGDGKTADEVAGIAAELARAGSNVLVTRLDAAKVPLLEATLPGIVYAPRSRTARYVQRPIEKLGRGTIVIVSAGTSDAPVAEEATVTAEMMGNDVERIDDAGVAGIHRLLHRRERLMQASVVVAVAGMEGALPSVVGGLVGVPVIAVPTSVGYGASFGGLAALLAMLNGCAAGVTVVNIDNGFGAGYAAALMNRVSPPATTGATR